MIYLSCRNSSHPVFVEKEVKMKLKRCLTPLVFLVLSAASLYIVLAFFTKWIFVWCIYALPILNCCYSHFFLDNWRKSIFFILYNGILVYLPIVAFLIFLAITTEIGDLFLVGCIGFVWCLFWGFIGLIGKKTEKQTEIILPNDIKIPEE